jgi:hypothetical protein
MTDRLDPTLAALPPLPHPYREALVAVGPLAVLLALPGTAGWIAILAGAPDGPLPLLLLIAGLLGAVLALVCIIVWLLGCVAMRGARRFWESGRPLVRWVYSEAEWRPIATARWESQRGDWLLQWTGMTVIFGLVGVLTGLLIGADDNAALGGSLLGLLIGAALGAIMGAAVAGGSRWAAWSASRRKGPVAVALGYSELYDGNDYFRGDGVRRYVREAVWAAENAAHLEIHVYRPKVRGDPNEQWTVMVPPRLRDNVDAIKHQLAELPPWSS